MKVNIYASETHNIKQVKIVRKRNGARKFTGMSIGSSESDAVVFWMRTKADRRRLADILENAASLIRAEDKSCVILINKTPIKTKAKTVEGLYREVQKAYRRKNS